MHQEQGHAFPALQDGLKDAFLAAVISFLVKLHRGEVVVRDLLKDSESDTSDCFTFDVAPKGRGNSVQWGRRDEQTCWQHVFCVL